MCMNCVSQFEVTVTKALLVGAVLKGPAHHALAAVGLVDPVDPLRRDVRTIAFLTSLDLDPVEILGEAVVDRAARWVPQPRAARWAWAWPMRSHTLLTVT